jgi:glutamate formiminotransferase
MEIVECVPNFSEGRNKKTFSIMEDSLKGIKNCHLLNIDPDSDYNRVVVTFAGDKEGILKGAVELSKAAADCIDMRTQTGEHPRIGAIDVVPFVPVKNISVEECVEISKKYGNIISKELNVPVYLYEYSAKETWRKNLSDIRKGEYEGLPEKLKSPDWQPDFGKAEFNPKLGAIVTGARDFLIAYNVNIISKDVKYAKEISEILRESGRPKRDEAGKIIKINNETAREAGRLKFLKAMGVFLTGYKITQVSTNITNYKATPLHVVFEEVKKEAEKIGVEVRGSEIVGMVPLDALLEAGKFYSKGKYKDEESLVDAAVENLGLNYLKPFNKKKKIIDYLI